MAAKALVTVGCAALLILSAACGSRDSSGGGGGSAAAPDTARLRQVYGQIDTTYDSLTARYDVMSSQLSPEERQLYQSMQQMHGQVAGMHDTMMGGRGMMGRGGMMQGGARGGASSGAVREWDQQMMSMHQAMATLFQRSGAEGMAALHQRMAQLYGQALGYESEGAPESPRTAPEAATGSAASAMGPNVFAQNCAACHGPEGRGVAGVFPPLVASEWVDADPDTPIRIVLHGLQGPVEVQGRTFNSVMPSFGARLTDQELAAVVSYVRSAFGNGASAVDASSVSALRQADAGRTGAMTSDELR